MGFSPLSDIQWVVALTEGETTGMGGLQVDDDTELKHIVVPFYVHGALAGNEKLQVVLYRDSDLSSEVVSSDWAALSDAGITDDYWLGRLRFDFQRTWLLDSQRYWAAVKTSGYTRDGDTSYLGYIVDAPLEVNSGPVGSASGNEARFFAEMSVFGYE